MNAFNIDNKYDEAVKYIKDPEGYPKEIVVAFYYLYKDMFISRPKSAGRIGEKEFIIRKCLDYFETNKEDQELEILIDFYFNDISYKGLSEKYNITTKEVLVAIRNARDAMYYINRSENRFLVSKIAF